jgi:cell division initiation protein
MIDLTPLDVRKKRGDFRRTLRGYDPEEVDTFLELVGERFEELVKENLTLAERAERFGGQLKTLEGRESAVQEALVSAQKLREEVSGQTQRDADLLREQTRREAIILKAETETEISRRLGEAEGLIRERQRALEELERNRRKFLKGFRSLVEREIEALEVEEARKPLDETPLDLNFRDWSPGGDGEGPEEGETEEEELEAGEEEEPGGFETQKLEVPVASQISEEEEPESAEFEEEPAAESVFVSEHTDETDEVEPNEGFEVEGTVPPAPAHEPKWLFSLLKRGEEEGPEDETVDGERGGEV